MGFWWLIQIKSSLRLELKILNVFSSLTFSKDFKRRFFSASYISIKVKSWLRSEDSSPKRPLQSIWNRSLTVVQIVTNSSFHISIFHGRDTDDMFSSSENRCHLENIIRIWGEIDGFLVIEWTKKPWMCSFWL